MLSNCNILMAIRHRFYICAYPYSFFLSFAKALLSLRNLMADYPGPYQERSVGDTEDFVPYHGFE